MSRPPMSIEASPAGIISQTTGDRIVAASRRPDGTLRKELKIRPGYTPDEDVKRYRAVRAAESEARSALIGKIPGLMPVAAVQSAASGMSRAQKKNSKRKGKEKEDNNVNAVNTTNLNVPDAWDSDEDSNEKNGSIEEVSSSAPNEEVDESEAEQPLSESKAESKQIRAVKKKIRQAEILNERKKSGLYLPPPERAKVEQIPDLEAELAKLTINENKS